MESYPLRDLYCQYAVALAYIAVRDAIGDEHIGSAFHVGKGVFVTARHVVQGKTILEVATTAQAEVIVEGSDENKGTSAEIHVVEPRRLQVVDGPFYHPDLSVDIAVLRVEGIDSRMPHIPLGSHFDADLEDHSFVLTQALVLGYPPVPHTNVPRLVAARAEVNAIVDTRRTPYAHFVISAMARGGFSGGPVISEFGHVLGVVTESLVMNGLPPELGFMNVLSVEPIYACIGQHFELEEEIAAWTYVQETLQHYRLSRVETARLNPRLAAATISVYDDDRDVFLELHCPDSEPLAAAYDALNSVTPVQIVESQSRPGHLFVLPKENPSAEVLRRAANAAVNVLEGMGYILSAGNARAGLNGE